MLTPTPATATDLLLGLLKQLCNREKGCFKNHHHVCDNRCKSIFEFLSGFGG